MTRPYVRAHEPMLVEYLNKNYPPGSWRTNVKLGRLQPEIEAMAITPNEIRMLQVAMFTADAVVVLPDQVHIIEVATEPKVAKICQVKLYCHLFPMTREYEAYWHLPVQGIIIATFENDIISWFSRHEGIQWRVYRPIWFDTYEKSRASRRFVGPPVQAPEEEP